MPTPLPHSQSQARKRSQLKIPDTDRILFLDETTIRDYQAIGKTWFRKGEQRLIQTFGRQWGTKIIGCLDYEAGEVICKQVERCTAVEFKAFLKQLLEHYGGERIVVILDNARIHHAKLIQPFLEEHKESVRGHFKCGLCRN